MRNDRQLHRERLERRRPYIRAMFRRNRAAFAAAVLSSMLISATNLWIAWILQQMVDAVSRVPGAYGMPVLLGLVVSVIVMIAAFKALSYVSKPRFMEKAMRQYKEEAFERLTRKSIAAFGAENTADYISAFSNDASVVESGYLETLFDILQNGVMMAGALAMMLMYSPELSCVACAFFVLPIAVTYLTGDRMERIERSISQKNSALIAALKDSLSGFAVVKSFRAEAAMNRLFAQNSAAAEQAKCAKRKLATVISAAAGIAGVTAQLGTFLIGAWLSLSGRGITPGVLMIFLDLTANVINPIRELPEQAAKRKAAIALIDKLAAALADNVRDEGRQIGGALRRGIEINHLSFSYGDGREVLRDVSAVLEAGKCYAVVGASGSGKSTLLHLLMASHGTYGGSICYDGCEAREICCASLYELVSLIQQNVFVFNASIRDNVTMFAQFDEAQIERAMELSGLRALIQARGEDFLCGENGCALSGGERQRIAIARSLLRESAVLLMDEATSALDGCTGRQVFSAVQGLSGVTRVVVTHTLDETFLRACDRILVLRSGRLDEQGTYEELMARRGYFYSLYTVSQAA